ncbi:hypothetical protein [Paenibacillus sp. GCM10028914]
MQKSNEVTAATLLNLEYVQNTIKRVKMRFFSYKTPEKCIDNSW